MIKEEFLVNLNAMFRDIQDIQDYQIRNLKDWVWWVEACNSIPREGDIIQVCPEFGDIFGGHLVVVTEVYGWGIKGYIMYLKKRKDCFFKSFHYKDIVPCGKAKWYTKERDICE